jgi:RimJ/RimL family protein N-acetyltransferase
MAALGQVELQTPRLLLRPLAGADAESLLAIHADPKVMRYSNISPWTSITQAHELIEHSRSWLSTGRHICLGIVRKDAGTCIGTCTLFDIKHSSRRAEVGFVLGSRSWRKGYMTEALTAFLDFAFRELDLNRVEADTDPRNVASTRTLERLRFVKEGLLRERWITDGQTSDTAL